MFIYEVDAVLSQHYLGYYESTEEAERYKKVKAIWDEACRIRNEKQRETETIPMQAELYTDSYYLDNM